MYIKHIVPLENDVTIENWIVSRINIDLDGNLIDVFLIGSDVENKNKLHRSYRYETESSKIPNENILEYVIKLILEETYFSGAEIIN
jgi:hypothetical protein